MTTPNADEKFFMNDEFVLFKSGIPSQWYPSPFTIDGVRFVNCEQRMMYMKGKVFGDEEAMREVMLTEDPKRHKEIGRRTSMLTLGLRKHIRLLSRQIMLNIPRILS